MGRRSLNGSGGRGMPAGFGLALGGGAARGWAHLGVLRALEEEGLRPSFIAGTSMGAVVGALSASGMLEEASKEILAADLAHVLGYVGPGLGGGGLIDAWKVHRLLKAWLGHTEIEKLPVRFASVATDLDTGEEVTFASGDLVSAVMASIAIPVVFPPWSTRGRRFVDGGLVDPVPVSAARALGAGVVLAVDLNRALYGSPGVAGEGPPALHETMLRSMMTAERALTRARFGLDGPDILVAPDLSAFSGTEFHRAGEISAIGYEASTGKVKDLSLLVRGGG